MLKRGMLAFIVAVVLDSGEDLAHGDGELMVRLRLLALGALSTAVDAYGALMRRHCRLPSRLSTYPLCPAKAVASRLLLDLRRRSPLSLFTPALA